MQEFFSSFNKKIKNYKKIIIMTHKNMDIDGFSSALCLFNIINNKSRECYIYLNKNQNNSVINKTMEKLQSKNYEYNVIYENDIEKIDLNNALLIIVDVYKKHLVENEKLLELINDIVVIDHHIQDIDYIKNTSLVYINSNMSSVSEIMVNYAKYVKYKIDELLATIMLCAIEIDTNSFNFKTTAETYEACANLIRCGASSIVKQELLRESKDIYLERQFYIEQSYQVTDDTIFCVVENKIVTTSDLAIIADNLLQFENIEASFCIGRIAPNGIGISARSIGNIDVQEIMCKMGGGGHKTDAATKIDNKSIKDCLQDLTTIIIIMKVILLKDVKGQGKKDDIIDVKPGYAMNFLIKNGYGVAATETSIKRLDIEISDRKEKEKELIASCEKTKEKLSKITLKFKVKTGSGDRVFGSISTKQISDELKKQSFNIDKKMINLREPISSLGYHDVEITLHKKVIANVKIMLVKED